MTNNKWLKAVNSVNRERYQIPPGWETKEQVAIGLQCDPDRVVNLIKPAIDAGRVETQRFSVWDESRRLAVPVQCYRLVDGDAPAKPTKTALTPRTRASGGVGRTLDERIAASIDSNPDAPDYQIAKNIGTTVGEVRRVRASL
jgi:hypothetical protein